MRRCVSSSAAGRARLALLAVALLCGCRVREAIVCSEDRDCPTGAACARGSGQTRGLCATRSISDAAIEDLGPPDMANPECTPGASPMAQGICPPERPICDPSAKCRACAAHAECASDACRLDGTCAATSQLALVDAAASCSGADGSTIAPYCDLQTALASLGGKTVVRVRGASKPYGAATITSSVEILGPDVGSPLEAVVQGGDTPALALTDVAGTVTIAGLRLAGTKGALPNLRCTGATQLVLARLVAADAGGFGIESAGCSLSATALRLLGNRQGGLQHSGGTLALDSSIVGDNLGPGLEIDTPLDVTLRSLTIVNNQAPPAAGRAGAVHNKHVGTTLAIDASILWNNSLLAQSPLYGTSGTRLRANVTLVGAENKPPDFAGAHDYHLGGRTANNLACCIDQLADGPARDVDGQARPLGPSFDIGADEVP